MAYWYNPDTGELDYYRSDTELALLYLKLDSTNYSSSGIETTLNANFVNITGDTMTGALIMQTTSPVNFGDTGTQIYQSVDGQLDIDADVEIEFATPLFDNNAVLNKFAAPINIGGVDGFIQDSAVSFYAFKYADNVLGAGVTNTGVYFNLATSAIEHHFNGTAWLQSFTNGNLSITGNFIFDGTADCTITWNEAGATDFLDIDQHVRLTVNNGSLYFSDGIQKILGDSNAVFIYADADSKLILDDTATMMWRVLNGDIIFNPGISAAYCEMYPNAGDYLKIGDGAGVVTSHSFNTNEDLFVEGRLEVDGVLYADGGIETDSNTGTIAFDFIRHTIIAGETATFNVAWNKATTKNVINLHAVTVDESDANDKLSTDAWTTGGLQDHELSYDGTNITVKGQSASWEIGDIITIWIVYEK